MKKRVLIRAPLLSYSGYGTHARQVFRWLLTQQNVELRTAIVPWGMTPWMINPDFENGLIKEIMARSINDSDKNHPYDLSIQLQLPNEWDSNVANINVGISAFVETDQCNPAWIDCCNRMSKVIVPSEFIAGVIKNSGDCTVPLDVVPECFYDEIIDENIPEFSLDLNTSFNFLVFGQFTGNNPENDRKNLFNTLKILCETFGDDPDVGIILKTNSGRNTTIDKAITEKTIAQLIKEVRKGEFPKVHLLHGSLNARQVAGLYRNSTIKALVTLTRGEGFGLPILEAAASGLPILATNWSAHLDFLKKGRFIPINYTLQDIPKSRKDGEIFIDGAKWAEPSIEDAKTKLAKFRKSHFVPQKWANDLREKLIPLYSQRAINTHYDKALGEYLK
ncbi:MAG: hypothetical protein CMB80_08890 [Flammeovirgaceae bacterium]|nr:hypothetical protein [Flammeovirgaceae bacterium]